VEPAAAFQFSSVVVEVSCYPHEALQKEAQLPFNFERIHSVLVVTLSELSSFSHSGFPIQIFSDEKEMTTESPNSHQKSNANTSIFDSRSDCEPSVSFAKCDHIASHFPG
jgi:hypothetical protein